MTKKDDTQKAAKEDPELRKALDEGGLLVAITVQDKSDVRICRQLIPAALLTHGTLPKTFFARGLLHNMVEQLNLETREGHRIITPGGTL